MKESSFILSQYQYEYVYYVTSMIHENQNVSSRLIRSNRIRNDSESQLSYQTQQCTKRIFLQCKSVNEKGHRCSISFATKYYYFFKR